jgi:hypothetical protein
MEPDATATTQNPALKKAVDGVAKSLAVLYMECHKANPDGPECEAVNAMQKAVAEIDRMSGGDGMVPGDQQSAPAPQTFDQAALATGDMMQAEAAKRAQAQSAAAGM